MSGTEQTEFDDGTVKGRIQQALSVREEGGARSSRLVTDDDYLQREDPAYLVQGRIPSGGIGQIIGPYGAGKTFVGIDLAYSVAWSIEQWAGGAIIEHGPAVYVTMEGGFGFRKRLEAWRMAHPDAAPAGGLYLLPEEDLNLLVPGSVARLVDEMLQLPARPVLCIIDTQARATTGADENSARDMGIAFDSLSAISSLVGCATMTVHHTGFSQEAQKRGRGSSAQGGTLDFQFSVADRKVSCPKMKDAEAPEPWHFVLEPSGQSVWAKPAGNNDAVLESLDVRNIKKTLGAKEAFFYTVTSLKREAPGAQDRLRDCIQRLIDNERIEQRPDGRLRWAG